MQNPWFKHFFSTDQFSSHDCNRQIEKKGAVSKNIILSISNSLYK